MAEILVVDDNEQLRQLMCKRLTPDGAVDLKFSHQIGSRLPDWHASI
jgi:CheY-like chemotaxis protein